MTEGEHDESSGAVLPPGAEQWIMEYRNRALTGKREETVAAYVRVLSQVTQWIAGLPENQGRFSPGLLTPETIASYMREHAHVYSPSHLMRVRSVLHGFGLWLIAQGELADCPTGGISLPARAAAVSPGALTEQQRKALRTLIERSAGVRGRAIFYLSYAAGCRVREVSSLLLEHTDVSEQGGTLHLGIPGGTERDIVLAASASQPLFLYISSGKREQSAYVFTSQRQRPVVPSGDSDGWRLRESSIHAWFKALKLSATDEERSLIGTLTFHDLRIDFEQRAREAGLDESDLDAYMGRAASSEASRADRSRTPPNSDRIRTLLQGLK